MRSLLFLSVIFCAPVFAQAFQHQIWMTGDDYYIFTYHEPSNMLISENCFNPKIDLANSKCEAAKIFKQKKTLEAPEGSGFGGKNPGAVVCKELLKKQIRILKNHRDYENSFCVFDDGSMVSAIELQALLKDVK